MDLKVPDIWHNAFEEVGENIPYVPYFIYNGDVMDSATLGNVAFG